MKTPKTKICTKCDKKKKLEMFHKHTNHKDGLTTHCKKCISIAQKRHYQRNKKKIRLKAKKYRNKNPEKINVLREKYIQNGRKAEDDKKHYHKHRKQLLIKCKIRYEEKKQSPDYLEILKEEHERAAIWRDKNRKVVRDRLRKYAKNHPDKVRKSQRKSTKKCIKFLSDGYIRLSFCHTSRRGVRILQSKDIPQELVEIKREYIKLTRKLRSLA